MKYFSVIVLLAFAAVALADTTTEPVEKVAKPTVPEVKTEKMEDTARNKRGLYVETYAAPYAYSAYSAQVPVIYHSSYSVPYAYTYHSYPSYYSSPLVVY